MSKFDNELSEYANLIEKIGKTRITQTQNLSEKLIINEVSYWDIFSAEMAWRHLTTASSIKSPWQLIKYLMKLRLIIFREWFKRFVIKRRFKGNFNKDIPPNSIIFLTTVLTCSSSNSGYKGKDKTSRDARSVSKRPPPN